MIEEFDPDGAPPRVDPETLRRLPLPAHVLVRAGGQWRRGWLIGRAHDPDRGWLGTVQYDGDDGVEITAELPADQVAAADTWLAD
jgi:hypothetical protein